MSTERVRRARGGDGGFIVGLVGRTGSGKSTVARALAADGAAVIDADALGHEITDRDPEVRAALIADYGPEVYGPDGALDRARVAARVFADREARARLDRQVHPALVRELRRRLAALAAQGRGGVVAIDAALLLEWGLERECDAVIAVVAPEAERLARLATARGWGAEEARRRLASQRRDDEFAAAADVTLENSGPPAALERAAREALARLRERGARGAAPA